MKIFVNRPLVRLVIEWLAVIGLYVLSARIVPHASFAPASSSPIWPPAAIAVAVGLVLGYRSAIGVWIGALIVNYDLLSGPYALATASAVATGVTCQMLAATLLLRKFVPYLCVQREGIPDQTRPPSTARDILRFIALTAICSVISPSIGLSSLKLGGFISWNDIVSLWITSWVSNYAGILTLTPLLVVAVLTWRKRNVFEPIVFPITTVWLGLSFIVSYVVWQNKMLTVTDRLRQDTQEYARQFERNIERTFERLQAIEGLLVASERVSREDFRRFVSRLAENDNTRRPYQWVPRVKLEERKKFEERARREGIADFAIFEWNALGEQLTPGIRPEYFPLFFVEPRLKGQPEAGLDLASAPGVLAILNSARDTGRVTAMLSNPWPPEKNDQRQVFVYHPVYINQMTDDSLAERRERMRGFVRVEVPMTDWVKAALAASASRQREIFVFDITNEDEPLFLASTVAWSTLPNETLPTVSAQKLAQLQSDPNHAVMIELGGRQLLFFVRPLAGQLGLETVWDVLGIMAIGVLITAALIIYLRMRDRALGLMQHAEKHYRELFEAAPAMYVTTHDERGSPIISDCNELFLKTLKYERKDVIGRSLADFHSPESRIKLLGANGYRDAMKGKIVSGDRELLASDGRTIPVLLRGDPMTSDAGEIVGTRAMYVDNSEQKFAEEQMRLVVESAPNGMLMIDKNGMITLVNTHVEQLFGYRREELLGKAVEFLIPHRFRGSHPHQREEFFNDARARMMGHGRELFALKRDGSEIPVEIGLNPIHTRGGIQVLASVVDVTERRRAEGEIRALNVTLERRVAERTEEIRALNAGLEQRVAERTKEIEAENTQRRLIERELQQAHDELQRSVLELERRNQEMRLVGEMVELLESCRSLEEAYEIVTRRILYLLQDTNGALYMITPSRNMLECVGRWGESALEFEKTFDHEDCWALRRNKPHGMESEASDLICKHVEGANCAPGAYLCLPMVAHGEVMGLLHIRFASENKNTKSIIANSAKAVTEQLSLILANLRLRDTLRNQSIRDPQTGLFNRRYMEDSLDRELSRAERSGKSVVVAMLDIDHFKHLNDNYGHSAGDAVLRDWSKLLISRFRGSDIVCRYGGEEFVIILPEISVDNARQRLEQLRQDLRRVVVRQDGQTIDGVTVSMGIAYYPIHGRTDQSLLQAADKALYRAKELGRDCIVTASEEAQDDTAVDWSLRTS
jgi:diguanylate cyclase (GGDEF)-like protein/PAS domain S-box-containing protein